MNILIVSICLLLVCGFSTNIKSQEADLYRDYDAGSDFPLTIHSYFPLPPGYKIDIKEDPHQYSGLYQAIVGFKGNHRYEPFESKYRINIDLVDRSDVRVSWNCKFRKKGSDVWEAESSVMKVDNAKYAPYEIWGDMYFNSSKSKKLISRPFITLLVINSEKSNQEGILLIDSYEGAIFLPRSD